MLKVANFIIALLLVVVAVPATASADGALSGKALLEALGRGGYVVYLRHTKTNKDQKDGEITDYADCSKQRNLSEEGKGQAKMIGDGLKKFSVPVSDVLSSPYCRAVETAMIVFGKGQKAEELRYATRLSPEEAKAANDWVKKQLSKVPAAGTNAFLVSHTANLKDATGIWPKNDGDINVFKPNGDGTFTHVGTITPEEWPGLTG